MPKTLKQFRIPRTIRGIQIFVTFCAISKKDAAKILDVTSYEINTYCDIFEPRDECCINNKYSKFAYFDSGELCLVRPECRGVVLPYNDLVDYISDLRKIYRSYNETAKHFT